MKIDKEFLVACALCVGCLCVFYLMLILGVEVFNL